MALGWGGGLTALGDDATTAVSVAFSGPEGIVLRLGAPTARDATGRPLDARLSVEGDALVLEVDDADAVYPIEMVALVTGPADPSGPADLDSALGVTGLPTSHNWTVTWVAANTDYGFSVSTAGDVNGDGYSDVIIGADRFDGGQIDEGRAFLFLGQATGLSTTYTWSKESDQTGARFGYSVSTAGDVNGDGRADVIVGAPYYDNGQVDEGGAWVYHGTSIRREHRVRTSPRSRTRRTRRWAARWPSPAT